MEAATGQITIGFNHPLPRFPADGVEEKYEGENKNENPETGPTTPRKVTSEEPALPTTPRIVEPSDAASSSLSSTTTTTTTTTVSSPLPTSESQKSFLPALLHSRSTKAVRDRSATVQKPVTSILDEHIGDNYIVYSRDVSWISRVTIVPEIAGAWTVRRLTQFPESITYPSLSFEPAVSSLSLLPLPLPFPFPFTPSLLYPMLTCLHRNLGRRPLSTPLRSPKMPCQLLVRSWKKV